MVFFICGFFAQPLFKKPGRYILLKTKAIQLLYGGVCKSSHANYLWYYRVSQSARELKLITYESASLDFRLLFCIWRSRLLKISASSDLFQSSLHTKQQSGNMSSYSETSSGKFRFGVSRVLDLTANWTSLVS